MCPELLEAISRLLLGATLAGPIGKAVGGGIEALVGGGKY